MSEEIECRLKALNDPLLQKIALLEMEGRSPTEISARLAAFRRHVVCDELALGKHLTAPVGIAQRCAGHAGLRWRRDGGLRRLAAVNRHLARAPLVERGAGGAPVGAARRCPDTQ